MAKSACSWFRPSVSEVCIHLAYSVLRAPLLCSKGPIVLRDLHQPRLWCGHHRVYIEGNNAHDILSKNLIVKTTGSGSWRGHLGDPLAHGEGPRAIHGVT